MTKSEIRKYKAILREIDFTQKVYENQTETIIELFGIEGIELIIYSGLRPIRSWKLLMLHTLLTTGKAQVRNTIIGYFLATGNDNSEYGFILKYLEFTRILKARSELKEKLKGKNLWEDQ